MRRWEGTAIGLRQDGGGGGYDSDGGFGSDKGYGGGGCDSGEGYGGGRGSGRTSPLMFAVPCQMYQSTSGESKN